MDVHDTIQKAVIKTIVMKRNAKAKCLSVEALQIADKRKVVKGKGDKEIYTYLNAEFQ